jgi:hypothetical protein
MRRCVAGLRADGSGWIRLVSDREHGALDPHQYQYPDKSAPRVLDVIRVGLQAPRPLPHQPENWLIDGSQWRPMAQPATQKYAPVLAAAVARDPFLLGSPGGRVAVETFADRPAGHSLALVEPSDIRWHNWALGDDKPRPRVAFRLGNARYNLPLTDPAYAKTLNMLGPGDHPGRDLWIPEGRKLLFTVSLSEPYDGICYKLVAAVVVLPEAWNSVF